MYALSRLMLILAVELFAAATALACGSGVIWGWMVLVLCVLSAVRRSTKSLSAYGTAAWATAEKLQRAGMIQAQRGLIVGRLIAPRGLDVTGRLFTLFSRHVAAKEACEQFTAPANRKGGGELVRLPDAVHTAVFAPTGVGKGVSCVVPFLLTSEDSCFVVDFKGELAGLTAEFRLRMGHEIVLLDPFGSCDKYDLPFDNATLNPLEFIDRNSPTAIDDCIALAQALVVRGEEKGDGVHFLDAAEMYISGILATVVQYGQNDLGTRSLQTVRDILANPQKLETAIKLMCESEAWQGMLSRMGGQLTHFVDREKASALTTSSRFLRFLDTIAVAQSTKKSSFDPKTLRDGKMTVYLVLPPDYMHSHSALLRMWIVSLLRSVVKGGLSTAHVVNGVLDEASSLGHLQIVDDMLAIGRGFSIRLQFYYQSVGQLKKCFPDGQDQTFMSNVTQVFFGVNDQQTADYVSQRLGEGTIVAESGGFSRGRTRQNSSGSGSGSVSYSTNTNHNWQQLGRRLAKPEEVTALDPRVAITFTPGVPPISTRLVRYYEEKSLFEKNAPVREVGPALWMLLKSALLLLLAGLVVLAAADEHSTRTRHEQFSRQVFWPIQGKH
jgi:type IV secretion system protein VirD4